MSLQLAKSRRLDALNKRNGDRVLVRPAAHHSQVCLPKEGSVADYLIDCLGHGADLAQMETETGWSRATVITNLYKVAKKSGVGIRRQQDTLHLILPEGSKNIYPRPKVVAESSTVRSMADEIVITVN